MAAVKIPDEIFRLLPVVYPNFVHILRECDIRGTEFFTMSYIRSRGKLLGDEYVVLTSELTDVLITVLYDSEPGASGFVSKLINRGFLRRGGLTDQEKQELFGTKDGSKAIVALRTEGLRKLDAFNDGVRKRFEALSGSDYQAASTAVTTLVPMFLKMAVLEKLPFRSKKPQP